MAVENLDPRPDIRTVSLLFLWTAQAQLEEAIRRSLADQGGSGVGSSSAGFTHGSSYDLVRQAGFLLYTQPQPRHETADPMIAHRARAPAAEIRE